MIPDYRQGFNHDLAGQVDGVQSFFIKPIIDPQYEAASSWWPLPYPWGPLPEGWGKEGEAEKENPTPEGTKPQTNAPTENPFSNLLMFAAIVGAAWFLTTR